MKKIILFTIFMFSTLTFSQRIKILDEETQKPIPYAKIILEGKDYYKNTEENGEMLLENNEEISEIQSFGYENFKVDKTQEIYLLKPKFQNIDEIKITRPKFLKSFKIGAVKRSSAFYGAANIIWSVGKEIKNNISPDPLFIKSLKFYARLSEKKSATIKLNIYHSENGVPTDIYKSYVVTCYRNKKFTELVFDKPTSLPKEGFVIAFEWIFNKENEYEKIMIFNNEKKKMIAHEPMIGTVVEAEKNVVIGSLNSGEWSFKKISNDESFRIGNLAIELELTN